MPKVAVITGAGAGVGRATVEEFARQGLTSFCPRVMPRGWSERLRKCAAIGGAHRQSRPTLPILPRWKRRLIVLRQSLGRSMSG